LPRHAAIAAVTIGERGSIWPAGRCILMCPFTTCGSGNCGTPCERMHFANASSCSCDIVGPWPVNESWLGARLWHARYAARTIGEPSSIVEGTWIVPSAPGSGKLGTPWERMHALNRAGVADFAAPVVPTCATFAPDEPPQPAAAKASPVTPTSASARKAVTCPITVSAFALTEQRGWARLERNSGMCAR
jgi:hypothetical protein